MLFLLPMGMHFSLLSYIKPSLVLKDSFPAPYFALSVGCTHPCVGVASSPVSENIHNGEPNSICLCHSCVACIYDERGSIVLSLYELEGIPCLDD